MERFKYYVYKLIDPRDMHTFYVGKGYHRRMYSHEISISGAYIANGHHQVNQSLVQRINDIISVGLGVIHSVDSMHLDSKTAYERETQLRHELVNNGEPLTNISGITPKKQYIRKNLPRQSRKNNLNEPARLGRAQLAYYYKNRTTILMKRRIAAASR